MIQNLEQRKYKQSKLFICCCSVRLFVVCLRWAPESNWKHSAKIAERKSSLLTNWKLMFINIYVGAVNTHKFVIIYLIGLTDVQMSYLVCVCFFQQKKRNNELTTSPWVHWHFLRFSSGFKKKRRKQKFSSARFIAKSTNATDNWKAPFFVLCFDYIGFGNNHSHNMWAQTSHILDLFYPQVHTTFDIVISDCQAY